jgi:hypothetical protein
MPSRAGSPNKNRHAALVLLKKKLGEDFHPLIEMADIYSSLPKDDYDRRFNVMKEISPYCIPKLKHLDISADVEMDGVLEVSWKKPK